MLGISVINYDTWCNTHLLFEKTSVRREYRAACAHVNRITSKSVSLARFFLYTSTTSDYVKNSRHTRIHVRGQIHSDQWQIFIPITYTKPDSEIKLDKIIATSGTRCLHGKLNYCFYSHIKACNAHTHICTFLSKSLLAIKGLLFN